MTECPGPEWVKALGCCEAQFVVRKKEGKKKQKQKQFNQSIEKETCGGSESTAIGGTL